MKYNDIARKNLELNLCPFCAMPEEFILEKSDFFYVTLARAPYTKDHLLIIPNRHLVLFNSLSREEVQDLMMLLSKWNGILHKEHSDTNLLLRDGFVGWGVGKSVDHLHFHLIPKLEIGAKKEYREDREYLSEEQLHEEISRVKESFL